MNRKIYIINFDKGGFLDNFNYVKFHNTLTKADGVINWWHYLESSYIIVTEWNISAFNVTEFIAQLMPNKKFFVCEINLDNNNGRLPVEAWDWIKKYKS